jgi:hypothetical protein
MNWLAIKEQADLIRGKATTYPKRWFHEAKNLLTNMYMSACKFQDTTIDVSDTTISYPLIVGTKHVKQVRDDSGMPVLLFNVDILAGNIRFVYTGTYTVTCALETSNIAGADGEIPEINAAYHYAMAKYIAAKEMEYVRPERSEKLMAEFYGEIVQANKSITTGRKGRIVMPSRRSY